MGDGEKLPISIAKRGLCMAQNDTNEVLTTEIPSSVPVLPLRDVVVYPHMVIPLFVGREKSIRALDAAMQSNKQILLVAQKSADVDDPGMGICIK